jgi:hypothetical protein
VAVANIEKASVAAVTTIRPVSTTLPLGWEMGETSDGAEPLFINTGALGRLPGFRARVQS